MTLPQHLDNLDQLRYQLVQKEVENVNLRKELVDLKIHLLTDELNRKYSLTPSDRVLPNGEIQRAPTETSEDIQSL